MDTEKSALENALSILLKPRLLLQGVVEYGSAWIFTRHWIRSAILYSPIGLLIIGAVATVVTGAWTDRNTLTERYADWIQEELPVALADSDSLNDETRSKTIAPEESAQTEDNSTTIGIGLDEIGEVSQYGQLLLRRMLLLQNSNSRIVYIVAAQLAQQGRTGQAAQMMRRIAPDGGGGFAPAHAWLAVQSLSGLSQLPSEEIETLVADLESAIQWSRVSPQLFAVYAQVLESRGDISGAINVLKAASDVDTSMVVPLAELAARHDRKQQLERISDSSKQRIRDKMESNTATADDLGQLASLFLIEQDADRALTVVEMGLLKSPDDVSLRRIQSEAYRVKYRKSIVDSDEGTSVNLGLLDAALRSDPSNPAISIEVSQLVAAGRELSPELRKALETQLVNGQAHATAHIVLASYQLSKGNIKGAMPHLKVANRQIPGNPMILNNLALAMALLSPDSVSEALELSDQAVRADPRNAEYRDTQGEIRSIAGDNVGAVESYEAAISLDSSRRETREKLVTVYRELGMNELADAAIAEMQKPPPQGSSD